MRKMTLGNITVDEKYRIPRIEVLVDGEVKGYMSPFRGYFFQVSKTIEGEHGYGRSTYPTELRSSMSIHCVRQLINECLHNTAITVPFKKDGEIEVVADLYSPVIQDYYNKVIYFLKEVKHQ